jgi:hypothetical protein
MRLVWQSALGAVDVDEQFHLTPPAILVQTYQSRFTIQAFRISEALNGRISQCGERIFCPAGLRMVTGQLKILLGATLPVGYGEEIFHRGQFC